MIYRRNHQTRIRNGKYSNKCHPPIVPRIKNIMEPIKQNYGEVEKTSVRLFDNKNDSFACRVRIKNTMCRVG